MSFEETVRAIVREEISRAMKEVSPSVPACSVSSGADLLRIAEASKRFGYSKETISRWVRAGVVKRYGTERSVRVSEREVLKYLSTAKAAKDVSASLTDEQIMALARKRAASGG